ncbi:hypothetical protein BH09BAC5_BH09BAC5_18110 [soil metagenome]
MTNTALKKELHKKIDSISDMAILEAVYTILNMESISESYSLSQEQLEELDRRNELHDSGEAIYYTMAEMRKRVLGKRKK